MTPPPEQIVSLSEAQAERILTCDPHDISRFHYAPFKGQSMGLFQVAPGWQRMELSPLGHAMRNHLLEKDRDDG